MINSLSESYFRTYKPENGTGNEYHPYKGRGKVQKKKCKEGAIPQSDFSPQKDLVKKDMAIPGNLTIGIPV